MNNSTEMFTAEVDSNHRPFIYSPISKIVTGQLLTGSAVDKSATPKRLNQFQEAKVIRVICFFSQQHLDNPKTPLTVSSLMIYGQHHADCKTPDAEKINSRTSSENI